MTKLTQTGSHVSQEFNGSLCQDLSKKLCEICKVGYLAKCKYGEEFPYKCNTDYSCEECSAMIKKYPDFGQSENFVKLLEIYFRINKLSEVGSIEDILKRIINSAEINCGTKRMIQEAEWKYE